MKSQLSLFDSQPIPADPPDPPPVAARQPDKQALGEVPTGYRLLNWDEKYLLLESITTGGRWSLIRATRGMHRMPQSLQPNLIG